MTAGRIERSYFSRGNRKTALEAAAYRSAEKIKVYATGRFTKKQVLTPPEAVVFKQIFGPPDMPGRFHDRETLWNHVHATETRKNARFATELLLSLPYELSDAERVELVLGFVQSQLLDKRMVVDVCIHRPHREKDNDYRNHHAHLLCCERQMFRDGFRRTKTVNWNHPGQLKVWRRAFMDHCNNALLRAGHAPRVDNRRLDVRLAEARAKGDIKTIIETDRLPTPYLPQWVMKNPDHPHAAAYTIQRYAVARYNALQAEDWGVKIRTLHAEVQQFERQRVQSAVPKQPVAQQQQTGRHSPATTLHEILGLLGPLWRDDVRNLPSREWMLDVLRAELPFIELTAWMYTDVGLYKELCALCVRKTREQAKVHLGRAGLGKQRGTQKSDHLQRRPGRTRRRKLQ